VYENDHLFSFWKGEEWIEAFKKCDWVCRLALMRNGKVGRDLLEKIFNYEDKDLKLKEDQKVELICALLSNPKKVEDSQRDLFDFFDGFDDYSTSEEYKKLWELLSKWPETNRAHFLVYEYLGCRDTKLKVQIFNQTKNPHVRECILKGARRGLFGDSELFELGMKDESEYCRRTAYSRADLSSVKAADLRILIAGEDRAVVEGLANNNWIPLSVRMEACSRMGALGNEMEAFYLRKNLEKEAEKDNSESTIGGEEEAALESSKDNTFASGFKWIKFISGTVLWLGIALYLLSFIQDKQIGMVFLLVILIGQIIRFQLATSASLQLRLAQLNVINFKTLQKKFGIRPDDAASKISQEDRDFYKQRDKDDTHLLITSAISQIIFVLIFIGYVLA